MYAAGSPHPHKEPSNIFLEQVSKGTLEAVTDAEVLQEILHRYRAIARWPEGMQVYEMTRLIVPQVLPITVDVLDLARNLLVKYGALSARDALHTAVCQDIGIKVLCSYDKGFDEVKGM